MLSQVPVCILPHSKVWMKFTSIRHHLLDPAVMACYDKLLIDCNLIGAKLSHQDCTKKTLFKLANMLSNKRPKFAPMRTCELLEAKGIICRNQFFLDWQKNWNFHWVRSINLTVFRLSKNSLQYKIWWMVKTRREWFFEIQDTLWIHMSYENYLLLCWISQIVRNCKTFTQPLILHNLAG